MATSKPGDAPARWLIRMRAVGTALPADELLTDSVLAALVVEDLCWEIALADWGSREPQHLHWRLIARWRAEERELWEQRRRIRAAARRCGLPVL